MSWTFTRIAVEDSADVRVGRRAPDRAAAFVGGMSGLDPGSHPAAMRVGREFFTLALPDVFEAGLDWILAGLRSEPGRHQRLEGDAAGSGA